MCFLNCFQLKEQFKTDIHGFFISKTSIVKPVSNFFFFFHGENATDRPPILTKIQQILKTVYFENRALSGTF